MEPEPDPLSPKLVVPASRIDLAVDLLKGRKAVVYPTETFYGIMADAFCTEAIEQVYSIKGRKENTPLPCIIGKSEDITTMAGEVLPEHRLLMDRFWPGPLTLIFDAVKGLPDKVTAGTGTVGIRVPGHSFAQKLASRVGGLIATSANASGKPPLTNALKISETFPGIMVFDQGPLPPSKGSTILDVRCSPPVLIREGDIPASELERALETGLSEGAK